MWTLNWILYEPIWKRCRFRFPSNINESFNEDYLPNYVLFTNELGFKIKEIWNGKMLIRVTFLMKLPSHGSRNNFRT